jgi:hypothetical protein
MVRVTMLQSIAYFSLVFACWVYAIIRGGAPERVGVTILAVGSILTVVAVSAPTDRFGSVETGIFLVDVAALLAFLILALLAERFWPLWVAALQFVGTAGHAMKLMYPDVIPWAYAFALAFWSYPMLFLLALGTFNHQRRMARFGADRSWSSFSGRSGRPPRAGPIA